MAHRGKRNLRYMITRIAGWLAGLELPGWILHPFISWYIRKYKVDMRDYDLKIKEIRSFNAFFTRPLTANAELPEDACISPVEGRVYACGKVSDTMLYQIKGVKISLDELTAGHCTMKSSSYLSMYLSPGDYHRVHAPFDLEVTSLTHIPGDLFSVRPSVARKRKVFLDNERLVLQGRAGGGTFCMVLIGATVVGKISMRKFRGLQGHPKTLQHYPLKEALNFKKAEELAVFEMGSSVVLLSEVYEFKEFVTGSHYKTIKLH